MTRPANKVEFIPVIGYISDLLTQPTWDECLKLLNSDILERTKVRDPRDGYLKWMFVDEIGRVRATPGRPNRFATELYRNERDTDHWIAGDALLFTGWQGPLANKRRTA